MPGPAVPLPPIVVADTSAAFGRVKALLGQSLALHGVESLPAAKATIGPNTPLVLCGCHFDDGRLYDLLRYLKAKPALGGIPFLTIRALEGELEDAMYESVKIATSALGGNGFVDLFRWERLYGVEQAARQFAERVQALAFGSPGDRDSA